MRHVMTAIFILGITSSQIHAGALRLPHIARTNVDENSSDPARLVQAPMRVTQGNEVEPGTSTVVNPERTPPPEPPNLYDPVCQTLTSAAQANDLPLEFLTRLIWQESRFDARAISSKGAQGVAQFMPKTAAWVGLANPFDVVEAITRSGELLQNLKKQFGNLGLAAAAYNAGPKRVQDWLAGRRSLPRETEAYVRIVTGHGANEWSRPETSQLGLSLPDSVPCPKLLALFGKSRPDKSSAVATTREPPPASLAVPPWGVQLVGDSSQISALASFQRLQKTYNSVLGTRQPFVLRSKVGKTSYWYRVRVATASLQEAESLCSSLRAFGGSCLVQRN